MTVADVERIGAPEISRADARAAYLDYKKAVLGAASPAERKEYEGLWRGYKAISQGKQVIDLGQTMQAAGVQEDTLYPRLAIARADVRKCRVQMEADGSARFTDDDMKWRASRMSRLIKLVPGTFPRYTIQWQGGRGIRSRPNGTTERVSWRNEATALVPIIPPKLHPRGALKLYHCLWDAVWEPAAPKDPMLLRHLAGELFAIVAVWDLSELERAVMRGRL